jgi:hypothetical protein
MVVLMVLVVVKREAVVSKLLTVREQILVLGLMLLEQEQIGLLTSLGNSLIFKVV